MPTELVEQVGWLKEQTDLPICIGFGISRPEHIQRLAPVADGFIVGSAIVKLIEEAAALGDDAAIEKVISYVKEMLATLDK